MVCRFWDYNGEEFNVYKRTTTNFGAIKDIIYVCQRTHSTHLAKTKKKKGPQYTDADSKREGTIKVHSVRDMSFFEKPKSEQDIV